MKKILLSLMALLLMGSMSVWAEPSVNPDGTEFTDPDMHVKITKVSDGVYIVKSEGPNAVANFSSLPNGDDRVNAFINAFKAGTSITFDGNFSSIEAMNSIDPKNWKEVNLKQMKKQASWESSPSTPNLSQYFGFNIETLVFSDYPTSLNKDEAGLSNLNKLKNVTIGARMETIPVGCFMDKKTLETVSFSTITEGENTIGTKAILNTAFKGCTALTSITFPSTLETLGDTNANKEEGVFYKAGLTGSLDLSGTKVTVIGRGAFQYTNITSVTFPKDLVTLGPESFADTQLQGTVNLSNLKSLQTIDFEAFETCPNITGVSFPDGNTLTKIGNDCFKETGLTTVDMSMCKGIEEFGRNKDDQSKIKTFASCTSLTSVTLPPNLKLVPGSQDGGLFAGCTNLETVIFTGKANVPAGVSEGSGTLSNPIVIEKQAFYGLTSLKYVTFSNNLTSIAEQAFEQTGIIDLNLSHCHYLRLLNYHAFEACNSLETVKICSHEKVIKGGAGQSQGAFNNCTAIKTVEVVGCDGTDVSQCICENQAFSYTTTHNQTAPLDQINKAARLIYPSNMGLDAIVRGNGQNTYSSCYDYFVGNYKSGLLNQEVLLADCRKIPESGKADNVKQKVFVNGEIKEINVNLDFSNYSYPGNGWLEFVNNGVGEFIPKGEFLRTYSRSRGALPVLLPSTITAYRAIDFASTDWKYEEDVNGKWVMNENGTYDLLSDEDLSDLEEGTPTYSKITIGGQLLLRALHPVKNGSVMTNESYVPENTGVVLYSEGTAEDAFLMMGAYLGTDYEFKEYPNTKDAYEENRIAKGGKMGDATDIINMFQGSYDTGWKVSPVYPWVYANEEACTGGGYYNKPITYRNFGFSISNKAWRRLTPSKLKVNRAFAMIPAGRFNNKNESEDQMPSFTTEDHVTNTSNNVNAIVLISNFEDEMADGIVTIATNKENADSDAWYTLQGVKVTKPVKGGVYIHNNKKVVIK